jgi:hypothetical protein
MMKQGGPDGKRLLRSGLVNAGLGPEVYDK